MTNRSTDSSRIADVSDFSGYGILEAAFATPYEKLSR
jgi:hypothetical protein